MTSALKKLLIGLSVITILMVLLLLSQIREANTININTQQLPLISPVAVEIPFTKEDPILGNSGSPLTIVALLNFNDNRSREYYRTIADIIRKNPTKARLMVKHYPDNAFFSNPLLIHEALYCAGKQNKFWNYADGLAAGKKTFHEAQLVSLAETSKLSLTAWKTCLTDPATLSSIQNDVAFAKGFGLPPAPTIFLNNKLLNPEEDINLDQLLNSFISP